MYYKTLTNLNKCSKSLSFRLQPVGNTLSTVKDFLILEHARQKADLYPRAKDILDKFFRDNAESGLAVSKIPEETLRALAEELVRFRNRDKDNRYFAVSAEARRSIVDSFRSLEDFADWGKGNTSFVTKLFRAKDALLFDIFKQSMDFARYCTNRALMFSPDAKSGSCAHRIVGDNFPKYMKNAEKLSSIKEEKPALYKKLQTQAQILSFDLDSFLKPETFNETISTVGNGKYNMLIGGFSNEKGEKIQGLNEVINIYRQQEDSSVRTKLEKLAKNICAESIGFSFFSEALESDSDVYKKIEEIIALYPEVENLLVRLENIGQYDPEKVYIAGTSKNKFYNIPFYSTRVFGAAKYWDKISKAMYEREIARLSNGKKITKKIENTANKVANGDYFSLSYINDVIEGTKISTEVAKGIFTVISETAKDLKVKVKNSLSDYDNCYKNKTAKQNTVQIKNLVDDVLEACRYVASFRVPAEYDTDVDFYDETYSSFCDITKRKISRAYDQIRNFVTTGVKVEDKISVNFGITGMGSNNFGWDSSKEDANKTILLRKNGIMYLVIYTGNEKINPETCPSVGDDYEKLQLKNFNSPEKQFPKCLFAGTSAGTAFEPSKKLVAAYSRGKENAKKGEFYKPEFASLEDYNKALASAYLKMAQTREDWKVFNFKLKDSYDNPQELFDDVATQGFTMSFETVGAKQVEQLVNDGKVYMFKIENMDIKTGHTSKKNLFTIYWDYLFSDENLKNCVLKLAGGMAVTFRKSNGETDLPHRTGSYLVNKVAKTGLPIPPEIYQEIYKQANGMLREISAEAQMWKKVAVIKKATHDIIMGKRFSQDQFMMTCPIVFNPFSRTENINNFVLTAIRNEKKDVNFLGVKRGIRNLIYICVVSPEGKVLYQKSLNKIAGSYGVEFDYHAKLDAVEKNRMAARKNWQEIDTIKNLKHGYLSAAIPEVIKTALKYNAVIILENMADGFVSKSAKIEKNIYQAFESALLSKLEAYVDKNIELGEPGSVSKVLSLGNRVTSYDDIRGQNGISFYVTPAYTASVDPVTGFTSLFDLSDITNHAKRKEFLSKFDKIEFRGTGNEICFDFTFNFKNFKLYVQKCPDKTWKVTSEGERGSYERNESGRKEITIVHPSLMIKEALDKVGIRLTNGINLVSEIAALGDSKTENEAVRKIFDAFCLSIKMVNLDEEGNEYFTSCVVGDKGRFTTKNYTESSSMPCEADGIGAYLIALKGKKVLYDALEEPEDTKHRFFLDRESWLEVLMQ